MKDLVLQLTIALQLKGEVTIIQVLSHVAINNAAGITVSSKSSSFERKRNLKQSHGENSGLAINEVSIFM